MQELEDFELDIAEAIEYVVPNTKENEANLQDEMYPGSRLTINESLLLTMAFATRHKLSLAGTEDLLQLLDLHCPENNKFVKDIGKFQQHFRHLRHPIKLHYCCPNPKCQIYASAEKPGEREVCLFRNYSLVCKIMEKCANLIYLFM